MNLYTGWKCPHTIKQADDSTGPVEDPPCPLVITFDTPVDEVPAEMIQVARAHCRTEHACPKFHDAFTTTDGLPISRTPDPLPQDYDGEDVGFTAVTGLPDPEPDPVTKAEIDQTAEEPASALQERLNAASEEVQRLQHELANRSDARVNDITITLAIPPFETPDITALRFCQTALLTLSDQDRYRVIAWLASPR